eukprot:comp12760_c1_seq1/m.7881 comp12760_c1_seq1/g.7881  ORF comp12760_c1_seq1/g.7881 comp12760_c1_seq1/m.7881 type:complete len:350 (-) comp12760_c1_seq1:178-1227(-)
MDFQKKLESWRPPSEWLKIVTVDAHTEGEPFRVIVSGVPFIIGNTILERRRWAQNNLEHIRTALMWEPRGHPDMYGAFVTPPVSEDADLGVLFIHNEGYSTMCGHGIIALTKVALDTGLLPITGAETTVRIDSPAGLVTAHATISPKTQTVEKVRFHNVPSFVLARDLDVIVPGIGYVRFDVAFGGAFYAFVDAASVGLECCPSHFSQLVDYGKRIKKAVMENHAITHPFEADLSFLYGVIFTGPPKNPAHHSSNVCIFADGEVDRSPTGTGVSARLALHHARRGIKVGEPIVIESILGTYFTGIVVEETVFGSHKAVIPEVQGTAYITGRNEFVVDPADNLPKGFLLR